MSATTNDPLDDLRSDLLTIRTSVDAAIRRLDLALTRDAGDDAIVVTGQGTWTEEELAEILPKLAHLPGPIAALKLCSEIPDEWIWFSTVHAATGNDLPIQTRNEMGAMTRILGKARGVNYWPLAAERRDGEIHYLASPVMAAWVKRGLG